MGRLLTFMMPPRCSTRSLKAYRQCARVISVRAWRPIVSGWRARSPIRSTKSSSPMNGRPLKGEFQRSATIVNTMIKQLSVFTSEVTRVAREVGSQGKLGGQAQVRDVSGVWKDLTDSVNSMASNLTSQVRSISEVTIAVANGDLSKKITVDVQIGRAAGRER